MENRIKIMIMVIFVTVLFWFKAVPVEWNKQKRPCINVRDILCIIFSGSPVSVDIIICLP